MALPIFLVTYCSPTSYDDDWEFLGRQIVGIDSVSAVLINGTFAFTDTVRGIDTLSLFIHSHTINGDKFDHDSLRVVASSSGVDLTLHADIYDWRGSGAMPPTDLNPTGVQGHILKLPPPFSPGNFIATLHQPDNTVKLDTIVVR